MTFVKHLTARKEKSSRSNLEEEITGNFQMYFNKLRTSILYIKLIVSPNLLYRTLFVYFFLSFIGAFLFIIPFCRAVKNAVVVVVPFFTKKIQIHEYLKVNYCNYCQ